MTEDQTYFDENRNIYDETNVQEKLTNLYNEFNVDEEEDYIDGEEY